MVTVLQGPWMTPSPLYSHTRTEVLHTVYGRTDTQSAAMCREHCCVIACESQRYVTSSSPPTFNGIFSFL